MLDRRHRGAIAVAENGAERDTGDHALMSDDLAALGVSIGDEEADAGIAVGGNKEKRDRCATVNADAGQRYFAG
ncbi:hypothetical protein A7A08_00845 [Methyloligella halotolerans]|uniref:Uncharacterized protein n=1 Tax=Methyloligella halotolerans TaxID=1177755 RepID=A0A1E2S3U9_9HYPH|nr:hypothetical protein A7A08_00845 [Methyloligella halotolerans]